MAVVIPILTVTRSRWSLSVGMSAEKLAPDAPGQCDQVIGAVIEVLAQDDELVTTDASDGIAAAGGGREPFRGGDEDLVAGEVTELVVDRLERIDIDVQESEVGAEALPKLQCVRETIEEEAPIRETGERVVVRKVREPCLLCRQLFLQAGALGVELLGHLHDASVGCAANDSQRVVEIGVRDVVTPSLLDERRDRDLTPVQVQLRQLGEHDVSRKGAFPVAAMARACSRLWISPCSKYPTSAWVDADVVQPMSSTTRWSLPKRRPATVPATSQGRAVRFLDPLRKCRSQPRTGAAAAVPESVTEPSSEGDTCSHRSMRSEPEAAPNPTAAARPYGLVGTCEPSKTPATPAPRGSVGTDRARRPHREVPARARSAGGDRRCTHGADSANFAPQWGIAPVEVRAGRGAKLHFFDFAHDGDYGFHQVEASGQAFAHVAVGPSLTHGGSWLTGTDAVSRPLRTRCSRCSGSGRERVLVRRPRPHVGT